MRLINSYRRGAEEWLAAYRNRNEDAEEHFESLKAELMVGRGRVTVLGFRVAEARSVSDSSRTSFGQAILPAWSSFLLFGQAWSHTDGMPVQLLLWSCCRIPVHGFSEACMTCTPCWSAGVSC